MTTIAPLPPVPLRAAGQDDFAPKAAVFLAALPTFRSQANAQATSVLGVRDQAQTAATEATAAATAANGHRANAVTARTAAEAARNLAQAAQAAAAASAAAAAASATAAQTAAGNIIGLPAGGLILFPQNPTRPVPATFLPCDGASYPRADFPALAGALATGAPGTLISTNANFASGFTGWSVAGTGFTFAGGKAVITEANQNRQGLLQQTVPAATTGFIRVVVDVCETTLSVGWEGDIIANIYESGTYLIPIHKPGTAFNLSNARAAAGLDVAGPAEVSFLGFEQGGSFTVPNIAPSGGMRTLIKAVVS